MGLTPTSPLFFREPFPRCTGMVWINDRSKQPLKEGPQQTHGEFVENSHFVTGSCLDMATEIKKLLEKQLPNTQTSAKGLILITNPDGMPQFQYGFGEPIAAPALSLSQRISLWFKSFQPFTNRMKAKADFSKESLVNFLEAVAFVPTKGGFIKGAKEFSVPHPYLQSL